MAFKSIEQYNEERFGGFFLLRNDGDYKDVVFLYQSVNDVLIADVHYIKSAEYSGYCHCTGRGCPACSHGIRVQTKLFIPIYDIREDEVVFWDRSSRFEQQFMADVINKYANPSEIVFRITRKGEAGSVDTKYTITAIGKNTGSSYSSILASKGILLPDYYSAVCKDYPASKLRDLLSSDSASGAAESLGEYNATPRVAVPNASQNASAASAPVVTDNPSPSITVPDVEDEDDVKF